MLLMPDCKIYFESILFFMSRPKSRDDRASRLIDLIDRLGRLVRSQIHESGMVPAQWDALRYLARCNRFSNTPGALAKFLHATKGTVSQTLNALERKGLVTRQPDPVSGRVVRLALSAKGRALASRDPAPELSQHAETVLARDADTTERVLSGMLAEMQRAHGFKPFAVCHTCRHFQPDAKHGAPHWCGLLHEKLSESDSGALCAEHEAA
jgi:DNA-binding MarR family transcriptional regulator